MILLPLLIDYIKIHNIDEQRLGKRGDAGGGKPPPPTVSPVRPTGHQEGAQWAPPGDLAV